jgi:hypothetical protein
MRPTRVALHAADDDDRGTLRTAGIAGLLVGLCYPVIIVLYVMAGADMPSGDGGQAWLDYMSGHTTAWWGIIGLSVFTDLLWLPFAWGLHFTLRRSNRVMALAGPGLMALFVVLELTTSWPAYSVLANLAGADAAAGDGVTRAARVAAAEYGAAMLSSPLLPYYAIVVPAVGKAATGIAMLRGEPFPRTFGAIAIAIGVVDAVSVVGSTMWEPLRLAIVPASLLSGVWFLVIGWLFVRLSRAPAVPS